VRVQGDPESGSSTPGFSYNNVRIGRMNNHAVGLDVDPLNGGYINQNIFEIVSVRIGNTQNTHLSTTALRIGSSNDDASGTTPNGNVFRLACELGQAGRDAGQTAYPITMHGTGSNGNQINLYRVENCEPLYAIRVEEGEHHGNEVIIGSSDGGPENGYTIGVKRDAMEVGAIVKFHAAGSNIDAWHNIFDSGFLPKQWTKFTANADRIAVRNLSMMQSPTPTARFGRQMGTGVIPTYEKMPMEANSLVHRLVINRGERLFRLKLHSIISAWNDALPHLYFRPITKGTVTVDSGTDTFTATGFTPVAGCPIYFLNETDDLPEPLDQGTYAEDEVQTIYFIETVASNGVDFTISATDGGGTLNITDNGTDTHQAYMILNDDWETEMGFAPVNLDTRDISYVGDGGTAYGGYRYKTSSSPVLTAFPILFCMAEETDLVEINYSGAAGVNLTQIQIDARPDFDGYLEALVYPEAYRGHDHPVGTIAPDEGTWEAGRIVHRLHPAAGESIGWICTTAGTPGTWKEFGAIEA